ncbi:unnamed protein product [Triticum turgidum subsp. durum]|uniref:SWIM-type domain-containing protein n=1 Tax=Triticum turgidum subsp. durum TaxID=4567 RepID=A0A9R0Z8E4_TRITD|nr:unnamed protein product [Triticum turgidum subsp. durum]
MAVSFVFVGGVRSRAAYKCTVLFVHRFSLPDLAGGNSMMRIEPTDPPDCTPSESSMSDAGDTALIVEVDLHSTCEGATLTLSVPNLEQSIGKDDPQAPGCTKREASENYEERRTKIYKVEETTKGKTYFVRRYHPEKYEKWCRVVYKVKVAEEGKELKCECANFEHTGLLCCHSVKVHDCLSIDCILTKHILKGWTKDARDVLPNHLSHLRRDNISLNSVTCRHSNLYTHALEAVRLGDANTEAYKLCHEYPQDSNGYIDSYSRFHYAQLTADVGVTQKRCVLARVIQYSVRVKRKPWIHKPRLDPRRTRWKAGPTARWWRMKLERERLKCIPVLQRWNLEEVGEYDPENGGSASGDNCSDMGSYAESMTNLVCKQTPPSMVTTHPQSAQILCNDPTARVTTAV